LTLPEIKSYKKLLTVQLEDKLREFEKLTGMQVMCIDIERGDNEVERVCLRVEI
jgi:hypothetical protein